MLLESLAWFECQVVGEYPAGDHVSVLEKVIDGKLLDSKADSCKSDPTCDHSELGVLICSCRAARTSRTGY